MVKLGEENLSHSPSVDPGEMKWVNFHPPNPFFWAPFFLLFFLIPQTPQPGFGSITLLQKFTPHFKILDLRLQPDNLPRAQLLWNPWMKHTKLSLDKNIMATLLTLQLTLVLPVQLNAQCSLCHRVHGHAYLEDSSWDHHTKLHNNCRIHEWKTKLCIIFWIYT